MGRLGDFSSVLDLSFFELTMARDEEQNLFDLSVIVSNTVREI